MSEFLSDALFFAAHPDDGELLAGGLMASLAEKGKRVILADGTRGEMGTRGSAEERAAEAEEGARLLGVERICLELPDGAIRYDMERAERAVVRAIRTYKPRLVFTHSGTDHHPDHNAIHTAVRRGFFLATTAKFEPEYERHRAKRLLYFWSHRHDLPPHIDFIADITGVWEKKIAAVRAHRTQVAGGVAGGPSTYLTNDLFWHRIDARFAHFGSLIGVKYGEPYLSEGSLRIDDPTALDDVKD
jgi:bacillithiol biosynthesis deacetylase BshB1